MGERERVIEKTEREDRVREITKEKGGRGGEMEIKVGRKGEGERVIIRHLIGDEEKERKLTSFGCRLQFFSLSLSFLNKL